MDRIYIKDLEIYAFHGVNKQEKEMGQKFLISAELFLSLREAGLTDNLQSTVNYGELSLAIEREFKKENYHLIEKAAEKLAEYILTNHPAVERVKLMVKKPWAPIGKSLDYAAVEIERAWHRAYIGLGSNMGDKRLNLKQALKIINSSEHTKVVKVSEEYETSPVGYVEQDNFVNCAAELRTLLNPRELVTYLLETEKSLKRERIIRWGPRTIDLDVLMFDDLITSYEDAIIPHPRMHERLFVIKPLSDIAPYVLHPLLNKRVIELHNELSKEQTLI